MGKAEVEAFLTYLAVEGKVAASTQNQAFNAILFLYREVLDQPLENVQAFRAKQTTYLPVVLTPQEVRSIIAQMSGVHRLIIQLLYGTGMRQTEALSLRIKDIDFSQRKCLFSQQKAVKI